MTEDPQHTLDREVTRLRKTWNRLGQTDPLRSIMTGQAWQLDEFFETGAREVQGALDYVKSAGVAVVFGDALDFGCGVGRLTRALARRFGRVDGIDVSPSMIRQARELNPPANCSFILNESDDLGVLGDRRFDFIYSSITLQHIPPPLALKYIREMVRVLKPGGVLLFQLPSRSLAARSPVYRTLQRIAPRRLIDLVHYFRFGSKGAMRMHGINREVVTRTLTDQGCRMIDVGADRSAGESWESFRYLAVKE